MIEKNTEITEETENFAAMFEESEANQVDISVGAYVSGKVIGIDDEHVFVNIGGKSDGIIKKEDLKDSDGNFNISDGDTVEAFVISKRNDEIQLAKKLSGKGSNRGIAEAHKHKLPVEGRVINAVKGGFTVKVMGKNAFCPISQMDIKYIENQEEYLNKNYNFLIIKIEKGGRNVVISRSDILKQERNEKIAKILESYKPGDIVDGIIRKVTNFGVFIDIGGIDGLCLFSELSYGRVNDPKTAFPEETKVKVKIISIEKADETAKRPKHKILLSVKQVNDDPWKTISDRFVPGTVYNGKVVDIKSFGAFVELEPGLEGLVHISEMSWVQRVNKPDDLVTPGDSVSVVIQNIDKESKKISLSMRDVHGNPWDSIEDKYSIGNIIKGKVQKQADFGYFIEVEPGIVGLLPLSKLKGVNDNTYNNIEVEKDLTVKVIDIQPDKRKITLGPALNDAEVESDSWSKYVDSDDSSSFSMLGEKLMEKLGDNKID